MSAETEKNVYLEDRVKFYLKRLRDAVFDFLEGRELEEDREFDEFLDRLVAARMENGGKA